MKKSKLKITYADPFSIMAINNRGQLRQVFTPFRVQSIEPVENIPYNAWVYVDGVWQDRNQKLLYLIYGKLYSYKHFRLKIDF